MRYEPAELEEAEKRFWRDIWLPAAEQEDAFEELDIRVREFGPVLASIVVEQPDEPMLHPILGAAIPGAVAEGHLDEAVGWAREHEVDYRVPVTPGRPEASQAAKWLMDSGHELGGGWTKFVRDVSAPGFADPGVEVLRRGRNEDESFGEPFAEALGLPEWSDAVFLDLPATPGWHCYVAVQGDEALAHAAMVVDGRLAELALGADPRAGGHPDGQLAVLRRCIEAAAAAGCEAVFAEVPAHDSEPLAASRRSLARAGFRQAFARRDWRPPRELVADASERRLYWEL
jgi:hypothetical protein